MRKTTLAIVVWGLAGCGAPSGGSNLELPFYSDAQLTPHWVASASEAAGLHRVDLAPLTDQTGREISAQDVEGRIHVANFFFTRCGQVCPIAMRNLKRVQDAFADDDRVVLMSYSVTPDMDSVEVLEAFGRARGIDPDRWHLLTGEAATIVDLAETSYLVDLDDAALYDVDQLFHTESVVLVDEDLHIRGIYSGTLAFDITQLIGDIRNLEEVAAG